MYLAPEESPKPLALNLLACGQAPGSAPLPPQDRTCEIVEDTESSRMVKKMKKRICLVLDCLCAHDLSDKTADLINLQHYVIKEKRLSERETVVIFYDVVRVVEALHQVTPCPAACPSSSAPRVLGPSDREASRSPCRRRLRLLLLLSESSSGPPLPPLPPGQVRFAEHPGRKRPDDLCAQWGTGLQASARVPGDVLPGQPGRAQHSNSLAAERPPCGLPAKVTTVRSRSGSHSPSLSFS